MSRHPYLDSLVVYRNGSLASGDANDGIVTLSWADFRAVMQGIWFN